ncbi:hypothetical protein [Xylella taiwanensis]|uniref:hypothetical protein n=1 Tax=Xylella taiwanensis TaxID=1444770 RepID=UPI003CCE7CE3
MKTAAITGSGPVASNGQFTTVYFDGSGPGRPLLTSSIQWPGHYHHHPTCQVDTGSKNIAVNFGGVTSNTCSGLDSKGPHRDFAYQFDMRWRQCGWRGSGTDISAHQCHAG